MAIETAPRALQDARAALAAEWTAADPQTPEAVAAFYRTSRAQAADLTEWHATETRQRWTAALVQWAVQAKASHIIDIGCGLGHDLAALREALPAAVLAGVEPNQAQHDRVIDTLRIACYPDVAEVPLESADFLVCIDLLEHVPDPEAFLGSIAERAPLGCVLFEATATEQVSNPLHLRANAGWHPGRVLDRYGWQLRDKGQGEDRWRAWERTVRAAPPRAALLIAAYRNLAVDTVVGLLDCQAGQVPAAVTSRLVATPPCPTPWRISIKSGDALITRARAMLLTRWWAECADDVCLMVDDDIGFTARDASYVVERARALNAVVCGGYPVGDGGHLACRLYPETEEFTFGIPDLPPLRIEYGATGFMAIPRTIVDAIMATAEWCHEDADWAFKPVFEVGVARSGAVNLYLSEDWWFSHKIRQLGFEIYLDPRVLLSHHKTLPLTMRNMHGIHALLQE